MDKVMWVEKYRPKTIAEVIGNEDAKASFVDWIKSKRRRKAVLLYGPSGVGKTALVHATAHDLKYNVVEMNASDTRTKKLITKIAGPTTSLISLDKFFRNIKGTILLLDEIDGIYGREDRGGVGTIVKIISESQIPIVLTANITDVQKLRPILKVCYSIKFRRVRTQLLLAFLSKICREEGISAEKQALEIITQNSRGDVRSAINDLQILGIRKKIIRKEDVEHITSRNQGLDVYDTLRDLFSAKSSRDAKKILDSSFIGYDTLLLTIHDNLPLRYKNPENLAAAYDLLSKADIFRGRIGTEKWRLLRYVFDYLAQSTVIASKEFQPFNFTFPPTKWILLAWTRNQRTQLDVICTKIGSKCHVSRRTAKMEILPFVKILLDRNGEMRTQIKTWLKLDDEAMQYLRKMN
ncbi:replication factor C large subunit [Candidatus Bathyarchaeota archaeon]|nr:replication factor C large subunit [Candidatus Bathyarchaeota archaeon]